MSTTARLKDTERHEAGALSAQFGIVTGTLTQFADVLYADVRSVFATIFAAGVGPLVDTAAKRAGAALWGIAHRVPKTAHTPHAAGSVRSEWGITCAFIDSGAVLRVYTHSVGENV